MVKRSSPAPRFVWRRARALVRVSASFVPLVFDVARVDLVEDCVAVSTKLDGGLNRHAIEIFRESRKSLLHIIRA